MKNLVRESLVIEAKQEYKEKFSDEDIKELFVNKRLLKTIESTKQQLFG